MTEVALQVSERKGGLFKRDNGITVIHVENKNQIPTSHHIHKSNSSRFGT